MASGAAKTLDQKWELFVILIKVTTSAFENQGLGELCWTAEISLLGLTGYF